MQRYIYDSIIERISKGEKSISVIFHPRGGKSHIQRAVSLYLASLGIITCGLSININRILRDQMGDLDIKTRNAKWGTNDKTRMEEMVDLLKVTDLPFGIRPETLTYGFERWPDDPFSNGELFGSVTIQTVTQISGCNGLLAWTESRSAAGKPPLIFFDECQLLEGEQTWGRLHTALLNAGAYVVVMTGTAYRTDGKTIPGFREEVIKVEHAHSSHVEDDDDPELVQVVYREGRKFHLIQRADIEVPLYHGWHPPPGETPALCSISRDTFDPEVSVYENEENVYEGLLSEAPNRHFRRALSRAVRDPGVVAAGVRLLVRHIKKFRETYPGVKGIVFTGNDEGDEGNKHAKQVEREIRRLMPEWKCLIATTAEVNESSLCSTMSEKISGFDKGSNDILIVKQAAGTGLDAPSIKVGLDLSTTRTFGQCVQRALRVATPYGELMSCIWITPDDAMWGRIWSEAIDKNQGAGVSVRTEMEEIGREIREREDVEKDVFVDVGAINDGVIYDNYGRVTDADNAAAAEWLTHQYPFLLSKLTIPELAILAADSNLRKRPNPDQEPSRSAGESNEAKARRLRASINVTVKNVVANQLDGCEVPKDVYSYYVTKVWNQAKAHIGMPKVELGLITSISKLESMEEFLKNMERSGRQHAENTGEEDAAEEAGYDDDGRSYNITPRYVNTSDRQEYRFKEDVGG
jgi:hypothetical protein